MEQTLFQILETPPGPLKASFVLSCNDSTGIPPLDPRMLMAALLVLAGTDMKKHFGLLSRFQV